MIEQKEEKKEDRRSRFSGGLSCSGLDGPPGTDDVEAKEDLGASSGSPSRGGRFDRGAAPA